VSPKADPARATEAQKRATDHKRSDALAASPRKSEIKPEIFRNGDAFVETVAKI